MRQRPSGSMIIIGFLALAMALPGCITAYLERNAERMDEQIKQQGIEIAQMRQDMEALKAGRAIPDKRQQACNRAFGDFFEKAQTISDRDKAIALYREGLALCPDDDIAHYELGKVLAAAGRNGEAQQEFEAALKINPGFTEAKNQLDALQKNR
jgi:tetratricopeptide (TPR) repeat protein